MSLLQLPSHMMDWQLRYLRCPPRSMKLPRKSDKLQAETRIHLESASMQVWCGIRGCHMECYLLPSYDIKITNISFYECYRLLHLIKILDYELKSENLGFNLKMYLYFWINPKIPRHQWVIELFVLYLDVRQLVSKIN